jgi:hypothetical protein
VLLVVAVPVLWYLYFIQGWGPGWFRSPLGPPKFITDQLALLPPHAGRVGYVDYSCASAYRVPAGDCYHDLTEVYPETSLIELKRALQAQHWIAQSANPSDRSGTTIYHKTVGPHRLCAEVSSYTATVSYLSIYDHDHAGTCVPQVDAFGLPPL